VSETSDSSTSAPAEQEPQSPAKKRSGGLNGMLLADLKSMAGGLGIPGARSMKKAQLIEAIKAHQSGGSTAQRAPEQPRSEQSSSEQAASEQGRTEQAPSEGAAAGEPASATERPGQEDHAQEVVGQSQDQPQEQATSRPQVQQRRRSAPAQQDRGRGSQGQAQDQSKDQDQPRDQNKEQSRDQAKDRDQDQQSKGHQAKEQQRRDQQQKDQQRRDQQQKEQQQSKAQQADQQARDQRDQAADGAQHGGEDGDDEGGRRSRRRRGRDRSGRGQRSEPDTTVLEDDILVPAAGILDVLDNYAFVRTSGYLPGTEDVYVSLSLVRKYGLRRGDAIVGQVRQPREGERREKFNPMVRIDAVNGADPEAAKSRPDFATLTPLHPTDRLRLETAPDNLIGRVIDIAAPIGKGQRGLIVSPMKAGKTRVLQSIATSIATNNPECHLMVVLVDERPEEVTDFERSVKGEVIASTFDRPASDHTTVAELAIERAKRLVELGHDVVVLLDGITRLGRAYNLAMPTSGRVLPSGLDSAALYPPKRFFGAARNIEDGGSLTILATALVESGSAIDDVIFEEFEGTANSELWLRREFADRRLYPAIDVVQSSTRHEEQLLSAEELAIVRQIRRSHSTHDAQEALAALLDGLRKTQTNIEFLMRVQKTAGAQSPAGRTD